MTTVVDLAPQSGYTITHSDAGMSFDDECQSGFMVWVAAGLQNELDYTICSGSDRLVISGALKLLKTRPMGQLALDLVLSQGVCLIYEVTIQFLVQSGFRSITLSEFWKQRRRMISFV
jgi:hypothetical protein